MPEWPSLRGARLPAGAVTRLHSQDCKRECPRIKSGAGCGGQEGECQGWRVNLLLSCSRWKPIDSPHPRSSQGQALRLAPRTITGSERGDTARQGAGMTNEEASTHSCRTPRHPPPAPNSGKLRLPEVAPSECEAVKA